LRGILLEWIKMKAPKIPFLGTICLALLLQAFSSPLAGGGQDKSAPPRLGPFFDKEAVTVAVMDSGLGGLSVLAEAARKMKEAGAFRAVDFVFFNALFSNEGGYNSLKTRAEKIRVFDSALESLDRNFRPDIVLIACNTLSVLYQETSFSKRAGMPVVRIVDPGVELIAAAMKEHPEASAIIFGTPTTISEGTYQRKLEELGFAVIRIQGQSCPELESFIENDPQGEETGMLISGFVGEALQNLASPPLPLLVSLNCTHYGYSLPLWEKAFEEAGVKPLAVLNPNPRLADVLTDRAHGGRFDKTGISIKVVSMIEIGPRKIDSLAPLLEGTSPETAGALRLYERKPGLFEWKAFVSR
jgi:glutamate racemase